MSTATSAHNLEAERALLGAMFLADAEIRASIFGETRAEHFYVQSHRRVWESMLALEREGQPIDTVTVSTKLHDLGILAEVTGSYVSTLAIHVPTARNWKSYADAIKGRAELRAAATATNAAGHKFDDGADVRETAAEVMTELGRVLADADAQTVYTGLDASRLTVDMLQEAERRAQAGEVVQWRMSSQDLSDVIPLMPGKMVVLAMRSGGGKTSAAANGAQMTAGAGEGFGFHSVEMPVDEFNLRAMSRVLDINELHCLKGQLTKKANPTMDEPGWDYLSPMYSYLDRSGAGRNPLYITKPTRSIDDVERKVRHLYAVHGVRYHAVDYFQLLRSPQRFASRADELNDIGQRLKQLTADLPGLALLVLAQMNKVWGGTTPRKEDIRYGSGLCDSADGVTLGYRPGRKMDDAKDGGADDTIIFVNDKGRFGGEHTASFGWENGRIISNDRTYEQEMAHRDQMTRRRNDL